MKGAASGAQEASRDDEMDVPGSHRRVRFFKKAAGSREYGGMMMPIRQELSLTFLEFCGEDHVTQISAITTPCADRIRVVESMASRVTASV